jgi:YnbE-like lipoprotein
MTAPILTRLRPSATQGAMGWLKMLLAAPVVFLSAGCVQVSAPEKPIEINLNINIRQEVVVRLQQDVKNLIENNPGVF